MPQPETTAVPAMVSVGIQPELLSMEFVVGNGNGSLNVGGFIMNGTGGWPDAATGSG